jgi:LPS-assembly protein
MKSVTLISLLSLSTLMLAPFVAQSAAQAKTQTDAELLGWVTLPPGKNICNGLYQNPVLPDADKPLLPFDQSPVNLSFADAAFQNEGQSMVSDVVVTQPQRVLTGDIAFIHRDPTSKQFDTIDLKGHVTLREPGKLIVGDTAKMELKNRKGDFRNVLYRLSLDSELPSRPSILETPTNSARTLTAQGRAERAQQLKPGLIELDKASYSTCSPAETLWQLRSQRVTLNRETGRGVARHATLYVKSVPVFYTPYFSFPIDKRRKSGILFPNYSNTTLGGFSIQVPYYFNIAPNYDATVAPRWFSKRGIQINTEFRYLTPNSRGVIDLSVLPNDNAFAAFQQSAPGNFAKLGTTDYGAASLARLASASTTRSYVSWRNTTFFSPRWSNTVDFTAVSDDYYYRDFSPPRNLAIRNQVLQQADIRYSGDIWQFRGLLQDYQTLHPIDFGTITKPYGMLPRLTLSGSSPAQKFGLIYQINNEYTYFTKGLAPGETTISVPTGHRLNIQPGISRPINGLASYITPNIQLPLTGYQLQHQSPNLPSEISRAVPIFSVDSGVYFDREVDIGKQTYQQTLEPRIFYLYVPYSNQSQIPLFDVGLPGFNYDQLFRTNRFNGLDRIGDANQVTLALTTRFLDQETGQEKLRASIGQIYYFQDRRVTACVEKPTDNCSNFQIPAQPPVGGFVDPTAKYSPLAGQLAYNFNPLWGATANLAWDPKTRRTQTGSLNLQYRPGANRIFNARYNFLQYGDRFPTAISPGNNTNLSQAMFSFAWPIKDRWQAVGSWTYNLSHERAQNFFYGLEYNNCCVAAQLVIGRTFSSLAPVTSQPTYNQAIYFQIQLKGFGNFGTSNPLGVLGSIPGYQDRFGKL